MSAFGGKADIAWTCSDVRFGSKADIEGLDRHAPDLTINSIGTPLGRATVMAEARVERRLAAILMADVAGYSRDGR